MKLEKEACGEEVALKKLGERRLHYIILQLIDLASSLTNSGGDDFVSH